MTATFTAAQAQGVSNDSQHQVMAHIRIAEGLTHVARGFYREPDDYEIHKFLFRSK